MPPLGFAQANAPGFSRFGLLPAFRVKSNTALIATVKGSAKRTQHDFLVKPTPARAMKILAAASGACNELSTLSGKLH